MSLLPSAAWTSGLTSSLALVGAGLLVYIITVSTYRLTLHPLAKYPGPFLSRISGFAVYLQTITGDRHLIHLREHEKYGPVVRIGPNQLSFSDPPALRQIYQSSRRNNQLRKSPWYETIDAPSGAYSTHSEVSRTKHAFRRQLLDHAFSDASLRSAEEFVIENVNDFCKVIGEGIKSGQWSQPHKMNNLCTWLAYDIMGDLVFGKRFDCLTNPEHRYVPRLLMSSSGFIYPIAHLPFQTIIRPLISSPTLMNLVGGQLARDEHQYVAYAKDRVTERLAVDDERSTDSSAKPRLDMMHHLIHARDSQTNQPFTRSDLDAESSLLIAAGADTSSTTLAAAFFYLTLPSSLPILHHLQSHLRNTYASVNDIRSPAITKEPYLRAVIDETLRLAPPVPTHLPRTIIPNAEGGLRIASHFIPQGTTVGCPAYVLHHSPSAYPDSFAFKPERWIPNSNPEASTPPSPSTTNQTPAENPENTPPTYLPTHNPTPLQSPSQILLAREAFTPFSHGSRGCVGKSLAYLELSFTLARILWMYDIRRSEEQSNTDANMGTGTGTGATPLMEARKKRGWRVRDDEYQLYDCFLADKEGPLVEFRLWRRDEGESDRAS